MFIFKSNKAFSIAIIIFILVNFSNAVFADVDGIPEGAYQGQATIIHSDSKHSESDDLDVKFVVANRHIICLLGHQFIPLSKPENDVIRIAQAISFDTKKKKTKTMRYSYNNENETIKLNIKLLPGDVDFTNRKYHPAKIIGSAKKINDTTQIDKSFVLYSNKTDEKVTKSLPSLNITSNGYTIVRPLNNGAFFGKLAEDGSFTTITSYPLQDGFEIPSISRITIGDKQILITGTDYQGQSFSATFLR